MEGIIKMYDKWLKLDVSILRDKRDGEGEGEGGGGREGWERDRESEASFILEYEARTERRNVHRL